MKKIILCTLITCTIGMTSISTSAAEKSSINIKNGEGATQLLDEIKDDVSATNDIDKKEEIRNETKEMLGNYLEKESENNPNIYNDENVKKLMEQMDEIDEETYGTIKKGGDSIDTMGVRNSWSARRGNMLISLSAKTFGVPHGHAAIISNKTGQVIEALPNGVVEQSASRYWTTVNDEREFYIRGASWGTYDGAINYARKQVGKPYKIQTSMNDTSQWYCSKLAYKAFESQGFEIAPRKGILKPSTVLPSDIYWDSRVMWYATNPI